jgi:hypothetical protein
MATETNNGKNGGTLKGKPHSRGGIKAVVTDTNQMVELEGGEVIINKEASKKHWKELSRINQSAGGGVPILPPNSADTDSDPEEYKRGGRTIKFNPNHIPNNWIYQYAKKIKEKYPKVWAMGGNVFGNEAYKNLERVLKRGYWTDNEEWMYVKWQSFNARHSGDTRIAGIIANLKWLNKVDKGWDYMKDLIDEEIEKKYGDGKKEKKGWSFLKKGGVVTYKNKYNKKYGYESDESHTLNQVAKDTGVSKKGLQQIYNKGIGAYKTNPESVRPNVKSKEQWAMARVYSAVMGGKASRVDANELKMANGGGFLPPQGTLVSKDKKSKLDYKKVGDSYEFSVYEGETNPVENYSRTQFRKRNGNNVVMTYQQFINYIYSEGYIDDKMALGGELAKGIKSEREHSKTAQDLYNRRITPSQAPESIAREHLKEDKNYYSKLEKLKLAKGGITNQVFTLNDPNDPDPIPNNVPRNAFVVETTTDTSKPIWVKFNAFNDKMELEVITVYYDFKDVVRFIYYGIWKPIDEPHTNVPKQTQVTTAPTEQPTEPTHKVKQTQKSTEREMPLPNLNTTKNLPPKPSKKGKEKPKEKKKYNTSEALRKYLTTSNVQYVSTNSPESIAKEIATQFAITMETQKHSVSESITKGIEQLLNS